MKRLFTMMAAAILLCTIPALADTVQTLLVNGQTVEKAVVRMTFEDENVVLHFVDGTTQSAEMDAITLKLDVSGVDGISVLKQNVGDKLDIEGLAPGTDVTIYDASGRLVLSVKAAEAKAALSTKSLKGGVYLMKAGRQVVKFVKR